MENKTRHFIQCSTTGSSCIVVVVVQPTFELYDEIWNEKYKFPPPHCASSATGRENRRRICSGRVMNDRCEWQRFSVIYRVYYRSEIHTKTTDTSCLWSWKNYILINMRTVEQDVGRNKQFHIIIWRTSDLEIESRLLKLVSQCKMN